MTYRISEGVKIIQVQAFRFLKFNEGNERSNHKYINHIRERERERESLTFKIKRKRNHVFIDRNQTLIMSIITIQKHDDITS